VPHAKISDKPSRKTLLNNKLRFGTQKNAWEDEHVREWWDLLKPNITAVLAVLRMNTITENLTTEKAAKKYNILQRRCVLVMFWRRRLYGSEAEENRVNTSCRC